MKLVSVTGTRPQIIKASAFSRALAANSAIKEVFVDTGQHYDENMAAVFFQELGLRQPEVQLGIRSSKHGEMTGRQLEALESVFLDQKPDLVVVFGDTNSTIAGALAAAKLNIPVAHVEAGLRSFNREMPEEINRIVADHISDLLFAPTDSAIANLSMEGIGKEKTYLTGDVMYDVCLHMAEKARISSQILQQLSIQGKTYFLATVHRAGNTDDPDTLGQIISSFGQLGHSIVMPVHPRTRKRLSEFGISLPNNVISVPPLGYLDMAMLISNADLVLTDSGGVQKEAYFHKIPCVTLRNQTEWVELIDLGVNILAGTKTTRILEAADILIGMDIDNSESPYGRGDAAEHIVQHLVDFLDNR